MGSIRNIDGALLRDGIAEPRFRQILHDYGLLSHVQQLLPVAVGLQKIPLPRLDVPVGEAAGTSTIRSLITSLLHNIESQPNAGTALVAVDELPEFLLILERQQNGPQRVSEFLHWLRALRQEFSQRIRSIFLGSIGLDTFVDQRDGYLLEQQQVIISRLAEHWDPADSRTLTENTRLEPGQISSQLDRLVKAGVVKEAPLFGTRRTGYQLAERFFNIWFLMREASRRLNSSLLMFSRALADSLGESPVCGDLVRNTELQALLQQHADAARRAGICVGGRTQIDSAVRPQSCRVDCRPTSLRPALPTGFRRRLAANVGRRK